MNGALTETETERCNREGFLFPIDVLSREEAAGYHRLYTEALTQDDERGAEIVRVKGHLVLKWMADLARHPRILDAVESVLGPDILCWTSTFFVKQPGDQTYVSWHQDATYWGLDGPDVYSAWLAFTPSNRESGCMRVVPGTHKEMVPHVDTFEEKNLLSRGQEISVEVDESEAVDIVLDPGQMSLHHVQLVHGSSPNTSTVPRIGFVVRYIAPHVGQASGIRDSAMLVRGEDRYGHFDLESPPDRDFDPAALEQFDRLREQRNQILYREVRS